MTHAGLTISAVMLITTTMVSLVMILDWHINTAAVAVFFGVFALIEGAFVSANFTKVSVLLFLVLLHLLHHA